MPCTLRRAPFPGRTVGAGASSIGAPVGVGPYDPTITHHRFLTVLLGAVGAAAAALCVAVLIAQALRVARRLSAAIPGARRSEEHTSELQSRGHLVCRLLLEKKSKKSNDSPENIS